MTLRDFIKNNREELDSCINRSLLFTPKQASCQCPLSGVRDHECGEVPALNYSERRQWILNDAGLYNWARSEGVSI